MERDREQGRAGSGRGVSVAEVACLTSPTPHLSSPQLSSGERVSLLARECVLLSRRPEAESIQLQRPPLHLTFHPGDTDIQSNAVKLLAPARLLLSLMSIPRGFFFKDGAGRSGSSKVEAPAVDEGESWASGRQSTLGLVGFDALSVMRHRVKVKGWMCQNQFNDLPARLKGKRNCG